MTKKTLGYVRLEWTCPSCGSKNPGPQKSCSECGAPQPEDVQFEQMAQETLIADEEELARAKAGPDIHCGFCGARNPATAETCSQCGADLKEGEARVSGRVLGAHRARAAKEVACPSCGALNPATATECSQCGASMARRERRAQVTRRAAAASRGSCGRVAAIIAGAAIVLAVIVFVLSSRTSNVVGRVESVGWTRTIAVLGLGPVTYEDWRDEIPADGNVRSCEERIHRTQDNPASNAREVCGTPYTVDSGSGFGEVVQDCQYEVYKDWCEYTVQEWQVVDTITLEGQDFDPRWPVPQLAANQREGEREERYRAVFDADGKAYTYNTRDSAQFARLQIGSRWTLQVNTFNAVVSVEPAD